MSNAYEGGKRAMQTSLKHLLSTVGPEQACQFAMGALPQITGLLMARMGKRETYELLQRLADQIASEIIKTPAPKG